MYIKELAYEVLRKFGILLLKQDNWVVITVVVAICTVGYLIEKIKFITPMFWIFSVVFYTIVNTNKYLVDAEASYIYFGVICGAFIVASISTAIFLIRKIGKAGKGLIRALMPKKRTSEENFYPSNVTI